MPSRRIPAGLAHEPRRPLLHDLRQSRPCQGRPCASPGLDAVQLPMETHTKPAQKVRCVDANFSSAIYEWFDTPPARGGVYSFAGYALFRNPKTGNLDMVLSLSEFPGVCFHRHHFESVPDSGSSTPVQGSGETSLTPFPPAEPGYPRVVIRLAACVYQTEQIELKAGPPLVRISHRTSLLQFPRLFASPGILTPECRSFLVEAVKEAVRRRRFRMCIVWSRGICSFVEADGSVDESTEPPSGGIPVTSYPVF